MARVERVTVDQAREWRVRVTRFPLDFFMFLGEESEKPPGSTPGQFGGVLLKIPHGYPQGTRMVHWMFLPESCEFAIYTWNAAWELVLPNQQIPEHPIGVIRLEEITESTKPEDILWTGQHDAGQHDPVSPQIEIARR